jgi:RHS repeat-associated protein
LDGRSFQSENMDYKFTGKQRDTETGWDYFGARYYDARIANWTTTDPLFEKRIEYSPYNYVTRNPITLIDAKGLFDDYYIFSEHGVYMGRVTSEENKIVILDSKSNVFTKSYEFNDEDKDVPWIEYMIDNYAKGGIQILYLKTEEDIKEFMKLSGVLEKENQDDAFQYAKKESQNKGKMDYWAKYLGQEMYDNKIKEKDINDDKGGFYIFSSSNKVYNAMDAGNFLWGRGMNELGFSYLAAVAASQYYSIKVNKELDSKYDQKAIYSGYHSK